MEKNILEHLKIISSMDMEFIKTKKVIYIWEALKMTKNMAKEIAFTLMAIII